MSVEDWPMLPCLACGERCSLAVEYVGFGGLQLCNQCSEKVANAYWKKHSGEYLTWPNEPSLPRRAFQKQVIPESLRWEVFERDGFACKGCGSRRFLRADHVTPESKGGPTTIENLQTLCHKCNSKKGNRQAVAA